MHTFPLITIAIATYKVEKFIKRSLLSALEQTYPNLEILVIDDCSPDNSVNIVKKLIDHHPRGKAVRLISHPHNMSTGAVRNTAIDAAHGKYLFFLDGDDYLNPDCIAILAATMLKTNDDFVSAAYNKVTENNHKICHIIPQPGHFTGHYAIAKQMAQSNSIFPMHMWNKLFNLEFLRKNNLHCTPHHRIEDVWFTFQLFMVTTSCTFLPDITINYVLRQGSNMTMPINNFYFSQYMEIFTLAKNLFDQAINNQRPPKAYFNFFAHYFLSTISKNIIYSNLTLEQKNGYYQLIRTMTEHFQATDFSSLYFQANFRLLQLNLTYSQYETIFRQLLYCKKSHRISRQIMAYLTGQANQEIIGEDIIIWINRFNKWQSKKYF